VDDDYLASAKAALQREAKRAAARGEDDGTTLTARLRALRELVRRRDLLLTCEDLDFNLAEVVSAIVHAQLIAKERQRQLTRLRVAKHRAALSRNRREVRRLEALQQLYQKPLASGRPLLFAQAGLYQYLIKHHGYRACTAEARSEMDRLVQRLLKAFRFIRSAKDVQALRRHRRLLVSGRPGQRARPGLFLIRPPGSP
jgi:hypothetical protein